MKISVKESHLKHITVIGIVLAVVILTITNDMSGDDAKILFAFILGYVFKNGHSYANGKKKMKVNGNDLECEGIDNKTVEV